MGDMFDRAGRWTDDSGRPRRLQAPRAPAGFASIAGLALLFWPGTVAAAPIPPALTGICDASTAPGASQATFSPGLTTAIAPVLVTVQLAANCTGNGGSDTMQATFQGTVLMSCAGGTSMVSSTVSFASGEPPQQTTPAQLVAAAGSITVTVNQPSFTLAAILPWTTATALAGCTSASGLASTSVAGAVTYAWG